MVNSEQKPFNIFNSTTTITFPRPLLRCNIHYPKLLAIFLLALSTLFSCTPDGSLSVNSPNDKLQLNFFIDSNNTPCYSLNHLIEPVIRKSKLGFLIKEIENFDKGWSVYKSEHLKGVSEYTLPWGEKSKVKDKYKSLRVFLKKEGEDTKMNIVFTLYNDGIGFRYEFPEQKSLSEVSILEENTGFQLNGDHTCWWIPGDWDIYEHLYTKSAFSKIDATTKRNGAALAQTYIPYNAVNTPVTMKTRKNLYLSFHEAGLSNYSGMTLLVDTNNLYMQSGLVGSKNTRHKVFRKLPFSTPWRTIQVAEKATKLIESNLILNLNEPNKLGETPWIKPTKYMGIWWEMHLGKSSWDYTSREQAHDLKNAKPHGRHGATTENAMRLIDFASDNNIGAILVEGWNTGWEHWIGFEEREGVFDFISPYPDYDLRQVVNYGKNKGVEIIMHHETSAAPRTYSQQMDTAYKLMNALGIHTVKTGYVGKILPKGEYHHGQWMVQHYRKALIKAAKHKIAINAHEPIKPTGIRRTYPNAVSREGLRGQEFNAWSPDGGNPPNHLPTIAFTRMLAGPIDYTPGIFNIKLTPYKTINQVNTTLAHQLALYVVLYSPVQMAADLIESYKGHPAFQFIRDVGVDWDKTVALNGEVGEFVSIARKEKLTGNWFVGSITNEKKRSINLSFDFLEPGVQYKAILYQDTPSSHWDKNPNEYFIEERLVDSASKLELTLAPGGGCAISIIKEKR